MPWMVWMPPPVPSPQWLPVRFQLMVPEAPIRHHAVSARIIRSVVSRKPQAYLQLVMGTGTAVKHTFTTLPRLVHSGMSTVMHSLSSGAYR